MIGEDQNEVRAGHRLVRKFLTLVAHSLHRDLGDMGVVVADLGTSLGAYWHFAVVTGYDTARGRILLHSGTQAREEMTIRQFKRAWQPGKNWAITVLPPDTLPASASEEKYLEAVAGLEKRL